MCPVCFATAMLIAVGVTSTGGLAAVAMKKLSLKHGVDNSPATTPKKEENHG
jgi:hypothetical protein